MRIGKTLFATTLLVVATVMPALAQNKQPFESWFKYSHDIDKSWLVKGSVETPLELSIEPRNSALQGPVRRILVLYPRASSAYDVAITEILRVFNNKEIKGQFTVINFELKDESGAKAIKFAEENKVDLIFAMGSESTAWLFKHYRNGKISVVTVCSERSCPARADQGLRPRKRQQFCVYILERPGGRANGVCSEN